MFYLNCFQVPSKTPPIMANNTAKQAETTTATTAAMMNASIMLVLLFGHIQHRSPVSYSVGVLMLWGHNARLCQDSINRSLNLSSAERVCV